MKRSIRNEVNCPSYLDPRKGERKNAKARICCTGQIKFWFVTKKLLSFFCGREKNSQRNPFYSLRKLKILEHKISFLSVKGKKKKIKNFHFKSHNIWGGEKFSLSKNSLSKNIKKKKKIVIQSYILFFSITKWNFNEINAVPVMKQERKGGRSLFRKFALSFRMLPPRINSHIITSR